MNRIYSITTCLPATPELKAYLEGYLPFYCRLQRRVFQDIRHGIMDELGRARYVSRICREYNVLKRTVNSIISDMQGRISSLLELKKTELEQVKAKLTAVDARIRRLQGFVDRQKSLAAANMLPQEQLPAYRASKERLYHLKNRRNALTQKQTRLEEVIATGNVSMCFGTKKFFDRQYHPEENGFRSRTKWHNEFVKKRDSGIHFLGAGSESFGNQILQLRYKEQDQDFTMVLLRDRPFRSGKKAITVDHVRFQYMQDELKTAIENGLPVTCRISRKKNRWYLTAMYRIVTPLQTFRVNGVFGVDFNQGFPEVAETDYSGNLVSREHIELKFHGSGGRAETEMKEKLSRLVRRAAAAMKDICIEDLDFARKKAETLRGKGRQGRSYNAMIHALDYSRYQTWMENLCIRYGVGLTRVNPAYTSRIGQQKYAGRMKLTGHQAAAFVIARRGQGMKDRYIPAAKAGKAGQNRKIGTTETAESTKAAATTRNMKSTNSAGSAVSTESTETDRTA